MRLKRTNNLYRIGSGGLVIWSCKIKTAEPANTDPCHLPVSYRGTMGEEEQPGYSPPLRGVVEFLRSSGHGVRAAGDHGGRTTGILGRSRTAMEAALIAISVLTKQPDDVFTTSDSAAAEKDPKKPFGSRAEKK
jgi:hypothetical protein